MPMLLRLSKGICPIALSEGNKIRKFLSLFVVKKVRMMKFLPLMPILLRCSEYLYQCHLDDLDGIGVCT